MDLFHGPFGPAPACQKRMTPKTISRITMIPGTPSSHRTRGIALPPAKLHRNNAQPAAFLSCHQIASLAFPVSGSAPASCLARCALDPAGRTDRRGFSMPPTDSKRQLDQAYDRLQKELPDRLARLIKWLRTPRARFVRIPMGVILIGSSFFWFLPVVGIELLPLGLLVMAQDVPFLRRPIAAFVIAADRRWMAFRKWWRSRKRAQSTRPQSKSRGETRRG
jgi:hypothetical protein